MSDQEDRKSGFQSLTERERQVIGLAAAGLVDKQIGQELDVSINTLRTYWQRIRSKVGQDSRPALVAAYVHDALGNDSRVKFDPLTSDGWVIDVESETMLATDNVNDDHGLERGVPHSIHAYRGTTHPDDVERVMNVILAVSRGEFDNVHVEFRLVRDWGIQKVNASVYGIRDDSGRVRKVYGFRTQVMNVQSAPAPEVMVGYWEEEDYESEYFTVDEGFAKIFGISHEGRVHRSEINWMRHDEDDARVRDAINAAVAERKEHLVTDVRIVRADQRQVWGRARRRFDYQSDGRVRIFGTFLAFE